MDNDNLIDESRKGKYKYVAHSKCPHLSRLIDCNAGGFGTLECMRPDFHEKCGFRARHEEVVKGRDLTKPPDM